MAVKHKHAGGMPDPHNVVTIDLDIMVDLKSRRASVSQTAPFVQSVLASMEAKQFGEKERFAVELAMEELFPDIVNYCERPAVHARAQLDATQVKVELKWGQSKGVKLEEVGSLRQAEIAEMAKDTKAYEKSLQDRVEMKDEAGELGGAGLGLVLVKSFVDEFTSSFDSDRKEMTAVIVKRKVS